jgi:branched-chain amino acid aminotransferase
MPTRVLIDDAIFDENTASISIFDRGFLYGDSVYEVTRTAGGRPVDLERHLVRLERSAAAILLPTRTLAAAGNPDSYIRIILTRGSGEIGLDPALAVAPRLIVIVRPLHLPAPELYREGCAVALVGVRRNLRRAVDPAVKSGNYLNNILALAEAKRSGAHEAIMCNAEGHVVEGSTSNIFVVRGGVVRTPVLEDGLLDGITRGRVIELCRAAGFPVEETHLLPGDLGGAEEAFLTSSIRGVLPITRVDGARLASGKPGPMTRELMRRYDALLL